MRAVGEKSSGNDNQRGSSHREECAKIQPHARAEDRHADQHLRAGAAAERAGLTSLLASWNLEVVAAANATDLWPKLLALSEVPDLIICDLGLDDGVDGPALIDHLREEYNQPIPALLVTADLSAQRLQPVAAGGLVLLYKPLSPQALRQAVAAALAPSDAAKALPG